MLVDVEDKPTVVTITSDDVKRLKKALKKGDRKTREGLDIPDAEIGGLQKKFDDAEPGPTKGEVIKPAATNKQLVAFLERTERVEEERAELAGDLKEIYAEVKGCGFDTRIVRKLISLRKQDEAERLEAEKLLATYMRAVGMTVQIDMGF